MADHSERIAEIDSILQAGAQSVTTDGTAVTFNFDALRQERRQLMAEDDGNKGRRPVASNIFLGGF